MRVAINGFGRIGRAVFRLLDSKPGAQVVAINDVADDEALAYLLKHDTVMGAFPGKVTVADGVMKTENQSVKMLAVRNPTELPWTDLGVEYVVESTGVFRKREQCAMHIQAGAKKVILTVPSQDKVDATIVLGVNDEQLRPEHQIISNASCTTNCLAPIVAVLDREFGIEYGLMNTVHAYTNDQRLADVPHSDWRRSRAAAENAIPTSTGAARAVGEVLPQLKGKLDGMAIRVPVPDGSVVDLVATLKKDVSARDVNEAIRAAAQTPKLGRVIRYSEGPLVSSDIIGDPHSSIFDSPLTLLLDKRFVKVVSWYDNEWGYSNRVVDLIDLMEQQKG